MTQIVNARFYRLGVNRSWEASWAASKLLYTPYITHDLILFKYIKLFISQYSAPLYFRFPHNDTEENKSEESTIDDNISDPIPKNTNMEVKDENSAIEWRKRLKSVKSKNTLNLTKKWLITRRKYRVQQRINDLRIKIRKVNYKLPKKYRSDIEKHTQLIDISPQPPVETFAANAKKISGNDRIIHNPFTKIGLVFSHLNILRQRALNLKVFISDYDAYEKINSLSKRYLKRKIKRRLKILLRGKLSKKLYPILKKNRKNPLISLRLRSNLLLAKSRKVSHNFTKFTNNVIKIGTLNKFKHSRIILKRKTIRKMIPRRVRRFMLNRGKLFSTNYALKQLTFSTEMLIKQRNIARPTAKRLNIFYKFLRRLVILNNIKRHTVNHPRIISLIRDFIKPIVTLSFSTPKLKSNFNFGKLRQLHKTMPKINKKVKIKSQPSHTTLANKKSFDAKKQKYGNNKYKHSKSTNKKSKYDNL